MYLVSNIASQIVWCIFSAVIGRCTEPGAVCGVSRWWKRLVCVRHGTLDCSSLTAQIWLLGWNLTKRFAIVYTSWRWCALSAAYKHCYLSL